VNYFLQHTGTTITLFKGPRTQESRSIGLLNWMGDTAILGRTRNGNGPGFGHREY